MFLGVILAIQAHLDERHIEFCKLGSEEELYPKYVEGIDSNQVWSLLISIVQRPDKYFDSPK
jgi:hypothetical protein